MKNKIQLSQLLELLPTYVSLFYVDYRDDLRDHIDGLQSCVSCNSLDKIYEEVSDAYLESELESLKSYKKELQNDVETKYGLYEETAYRLVFETYSDEIEGALYERDNSDVVKDLLKNTGDFSIFIDTGLEIEDGSYRWERSEQTQWLRKIKRKLKITSSQWDNNIRLMLSQASYGGNLVVYLYDSVQNMLTDNEKDWESVSFTNPAIAIINTACGSGDHTHLKGHTFSMPFVRANLFIDKYFKYNYVSAVCDMTQDWCEDSIAVFSYDSVKGKKSTISPLADQALQDRKYAEIFKKGGCTFGDMDMTRHRDIYYINDFPCGSKCPHCGTFWID
ncbi:MAG: hypothetical protein EZS26_001005 [Candidatus Ordinivivax streblomastigis]|uniref:Uncharacterized protein n=1 Tax=Candidatus Ordinivivax streblomastigis TaxID=2540710 RepID=A0A5M8P2Y3_9BACT|nr:MAG: hypothetical protein EZS26_001005 [Candidatus Ordinivivax streblomastigis]